MSNPPWPSAPVWATVRSGDIIPKEWGDGIVFVRDLRRSRAAMGKMKFKVIYQETDEGFAVHCPELPGCWSQGSTIEEARENVIDAVREYLAARRDQEGNTTP